MRAKGKTAIIVEGTSREPALLNNMLNVLFRRDRCEIILLPAGQNIYMLWQQLKADDFQTDIIEVLRESSKDLEQRLAEYNRDDFAEVYLFFDYDGHQDNLAGGVESDDVLAEMLETFHDETELGKLYVSYPMVEALRDYVEQSCRAATSCFVQMNEMVTYKNRSAQSSMHSNANRYEYMDWCDILEVYVMRVSCLFQQDSVMTFGKYRECVTPRAIFSRQQVHINDGKIFVLSAFPEFILDYFKVSFWKSHIKRKFLDKNGCERNNEAC